MPVEFCRGNFIDSGLSVRHRRTKLLWADQILVGFRSQLKMRKFERISLNRPEQRFEGAFAAMAPGERAVRQNQQSD